MLHKQLYKGKASLLYSATCRFSKIPIALKLYRKGKLSNLNWFQVGPPEQDLTQVQIFSRVYLGVLDETHVEAMSHCAVAVKVEREIRIHSQLNHRNIIRLFAAFEDSDNVYLAQEFASGAPPHLSWSFA